MKSAFHHNIYRSLAAASLVALLAALVILGGGRASAGPSRPPRTATTTANPPTDQIIVRFHDGGAAPAASAMDRRLERMSERVGMSLALVRPMSGDAFVYRLPVPLPEGEVATLARELSALPEVDYAEPDAINQHTGILIAAPLAPGKTPNDPSFADQWHYRYTPGVEEGANLPPAWDITTGSAAIVVAVLDTGIRPHADLAGRTVPGYDFITQPNRANDNDHAGPDNSRDADPADPGDWNLEGQCGGAQARPSSWHGTHVAGTIGAASNNGDDVAGVNWGARIQPVRVLGRCGGTDSDIIDAMRWSAGLAVPGAPPNPNPARVLNMSLGRFGSCPNTMQAAVNDVVNTGAVVVVSAGNSSDIADFFTPAGCGGVITVAASNRAGDSPFYSNYGSAVEVSAPGGDMFVDETDGVLSTFNEGLQGPGNDSLHYYEGTSMAAPHVAGVAALLLGEDPSLTPAEVSAIIQATARDFPEGGWCQTWSCGEGLLDAYEALLALDDGGPTPTPTDGPSPTPTATATQTATATPSPTATDGPSPTPTATQTPTVEPSSTPVPDEFVFYLPVVVDRYAAVVDPPDELLNGDFEQGNDGSWTVDDPSDPPIVTDQLPSGATAHGGTRAAYFSEYSLSGFIEQRVTVPIERPYLRFMHWYYVGNIGSHCGPDRVYVMVDNRVVDYKYACPWTETSGWEPWEVDLRPYGGRSVVLRFYFTAEPSSIYWMVDDVAFAADQ